MISLFLFIPRVRSGKDQSNVPLGKAGGGR